MPKTIDELKTENKELTAKVKETENKHFNSSELSDEDFDKVFKDERLFKHPRFKDLNEKAKKADLFEKQIADDKEAKLVADGKVTELLELEKQKVIDLNNKIKGQSLDTAIKSSATKLGAKNPETILKLVDRSKVVLNEDGTAVGVDEAIKLVQTSDSYLFGDPQPDLGDGANPANNNAKPKFKLSEIQDPVFYQKNTEEIDKAVVNNEVENDLA